MKIAGMLLLVLAGGGIGWLRASALQIRVRTLEAAYRLTVWLKTQLRYTAAPPGDLMRRAAGQEEFSRFATLKEWKRQPPGPFPEVWKRAVAASEADNRFTAEDSRLLVEFGDGLGKTDMEGQKAHGDLYASLFRERCDEARSQAKTKGRMEMVLWLSGAAALSFLLL